MANRTLLTPTTMAFDTNTLEGAGTSIAGLVAAGAFINSPLQGIFFLVNNTTATTQTFTVRAGGSGVTQTGAAAVFVYYDAASSGDLVTSMAATTTYLIYPRTTMRFTQADGTMSLDFQSGTTGTIWVFQLPYVVA